MCFLPANQGCGLVQRSISQAEPLDHFFQRISGLVSGGRSVHRIAPRCTVNSLSFRSRCLSLPDESNGVLQTEAVIWPFSHFQQPFQMRAQGFKTTFRRRTIPN
jgi:hypothetical protein